MQLKTYCEQNHIKPAVLAEILDVTRVSVGRYLAGQRIPNPEVMARIKDWSSGAVMPNDFYDAATA